MGECLISRRECGKKKLGDTVFATITVIYPSGSACMCVCGSTILTAPDTSGSAAFIVSNASTWTVSCADGDKFDSKSVSVTTEGENKSITLSYDLYLYNNGDNSAVTGGWTYTESLQSPYVHNESSATSFSVGTTLSYSAGRNWNQGGTDTRPRYGTVYSKKKIDVTIYDTLTVKSNKAGATLRLSSSATSGVVASMTLPNGTATLNLSSISGSYYISIYNNTSGDTSYGIEISEIKLSQ